MAGVSAGEPTLPVVISLSPPPSAAISSAQSASAGPDAKIVMAAAAAVAMSLAFIRGPPAGLFTLNT
jgi:hypothetical protein